MTVIYFNIKWIRLFPILAIALFLAPACKKDRHGDSELTIVRVSAHNRTITDSTITDARIGQSIRLDGTGFLATRAVYANGVKLSVNPGYVSDQHIILTLPSNLPFGGEVQDTAVRNTIKLVADDRELVYRFLIKGAVPSITAISHTLPREGEQIRIIGTNLRDLNRIVFPGNITLNAGEFTIDTSYTFLTCAVPQGATTTPGAIFVYGDNGNAASHNNFNQRDGIFIRNFSNDANVTAPSAECSQKAYNYGTNITGNLAVALPAAGSGPKNPDQYRQVPASGTGIALDFQGGFDYRPCAAMYSVLNTFPNVTPEAGINNLAIQFDYFIPVAWQSGYIRFELISDNASWRYQYAPWAKGGGNVSPVVMSGWETVTIPMSAFSALNGNRNFQYVLDQVFNKGGKLRFINSAYTDAGGSTYPAAPIPDFTLSFGNFRVVTYNRPAVP